MSQISKLVTTTHAAHRLDVNARTLLRWLRSGQFPGVQTPGGHWRVHLDDLETYIAAQRGGSPEVFAPIGPNILVVEDELHHAAALARLVRLLVPTATVRHAANSVTAGLLLGTTLPCVAFVDIELPDYDGIELIRRALDQAVLRQTTFVVVSGHLTPQRMAELKALDVRHILSKPVQPELVRAVLDGVLARIAAGFPIPTRRQLHG